VSVTLNLANYGTGVYGTAEYGNYYVTINTGVSATSAVESLSAGGFEVDVTERITAGVSATGAIGSPEIQTTDLVTGVQGTTALGTVSVNIQEDVTGVQGTTAVGTTLVNIQEDILGVSAIGTVGSVALSNTVTLTGVSATGAVSPPSDIRIGKTVRGWSVPSAITGSIGTLVLKATSNFTLTGVVGTGQIGTLSPNLSVPISSVLGTGAVESVSVNSFEIDVSEKLSGVEGTGQIGTISPNVAAPISGVSGTGDVSGVTLSADSLIVPSGVSATGQITAVASGVSRGITGVEGELNPLKPFTASGDAQLSTAEKKFGTASLLLDGTGDFVTTSYTSSLLTSSEWAVDFWVYSSTLTTQTAHLWDSQKSNSGFALRISSGNLQVIKDGSIARSVTGQLSNNTWHHIRLQRRYAFTEIFVDGFQRGQQAGAEYSPHTYVIGAKENGSEEFTGYIDEFRASTPTGLSAASFTPETEAYSLDASTEALLHFDGTNGSTTITNEASNVINLTLTGTANTTLTGVSATGSVNTVEEKPTEALLSVSATGSIGSVRQNPGAGLAGVAGTTVINLPAPSDAITVFDATTFSRIRTVILQPKEITPNRRAA